MREFKFRAFDEKNKIMHYDFQFIESGDTVNDWIIFISDKQKLESNWREDPFPSQQFKKMQCIGLKDEKGNDIYEGDFIKQENGKDGASYEFIGIVIYHGSGFCLKCLKGTYIGEHHAFSHYGGSENLKKGEVIGNIYESPGLLKVKDD